SIMIDVHAIASRTKVCILSMGRWQGSHTHKQETKKVNDDHHTTDVAKVRVKFCTHAALSALDKLHSEARDFHNKKTRPTIQEGMRMIPLCSELDHARAMGDFLRSHERLVQDFLLDYDQERASAPLRLNGLYDPKVWPGPNSIKGKFSFQARYL